MNKESAPRPTILFVITFLTISLLIFTSTGCAGPIPTAAPTETPTSTPLPTYTATPLPTATPTATVNHQATAQARLTATMEARVAEVAALLEPVGYTADSGKLVHYAKTPLSMTVTQYSSFWPEWIVETPLKDFVVHVDIQWDSTSGLAGCGILFRAEEDLERGAQYRFNLMRLSGAANWEIFYKKFNTWQNDIVSFRYDSIIDYSPNSINTVILVVQGDQIQTYINGKKMVEGRYSKLAEGGIAFMTWQESGETTCTFKNTWVWELNPPTASN